MNPKDFGARLREAEREARVNEALQRAEAIDSRPARPDKAAIRDEAPTRFSSPTGEPLVLSRDEDGHPCWYLEGRVVQVGDVVEIYTNRANGWLRGRFEWDGRGQARVIVNAWDPNGEADEDGLPPWIGVIEAILPKKAVCRWPITIRGEL